MVVVWLTLFKFRFWSNNVTAQLDHLYSNSYGQFNKLIPSCSCYFLFNIPIKEGMMFDKKWNETSSPFLCNVNATIGAFSVNTIQKSRYSLSMLCVYVSSPIHVNICIMINHSFILCSFSLSHIDRSGIS